ncbi:MAG: VOC family protein [Streptosporangiaceae bacterium]|jgi:predicted enzyme related to lactoylglutathione lyase
MACTGLVALVVRDYGEAIDFYVRAAGFRRKRWVLVRPPVARETGLPLARAVAAGQRGRIGDQTGGRVCLFLRTAEFSRAYERMRTAGVGFTGPPRQEPCGTVAVFEDLYGNRRDLIQPA